MMPMSGTEGSFSVSSFTILLVPLLVVSALLIVCVRVCAVGKKMGLRKTHTDCLAFTVGAKAPFQLPRLN